MRTTVLIGIIATAMFISASLGYYYQGYRIYSGMFEQKAEIMERLK